MGIRELELEMAAEQRRLCAPEVARMDVRAIAALKKSVDERVRQLQTARTSELRARDKAKGGR